MCLIPASSTRTMFTWSFRLFVLSVASAIFGFGDIAGGFAGILRILFIVFLLLLIATNTAQGLSEKSRKNYTRDPQSPKI
jgi:uncharacterized membrane protein YtjA (UPF0391 family)